MPIKSNVRAEHLILSGQLEQLPDDFSRLFLIPPQSVTTEGKKISWDIYIFINNIFIYMDLFCASLRGMCRIEGSQTQIGLSARDAPHKTLRYKNIHIFFSLALFAN